LHGNLGGQARTVAKSREGSLKEQASFTGQWGSGKNHRGRRRSKKRREGSLRAKVYAKNLGNGETLVNETFL